MALRAGIEERTRELQQKLLYFLWEPETGKTIVPIAVLCRSVRFPAATFSIERPSYEYEACTDSGVITIIDGSECQLTAILEREKLK